MDTIVIPFTWSKPRRQGPDPMERVGQGYAEARRQLEQALRDARLTSREIALSALESLRGDFPSFRPHGAGTAAAADAGGGSPDNGPGNGVTVPDQAAASAGTAAGAATAAEVDKPQDPTAPVPVVDDQGNPVPIPEGPYKGRQMLRPAGLDPHFFVKQGIADKSRYDALRHIANPYGGNDAGPAWVVREFMQLRKFRQGGEWDAQRVGGKYHDEYVDYATVAIGLYAASMGMSRDMILRVQDLYATVNSRFDPKAERAETYTHLLHRNVANTDLGYHLYQSGLIRDAAKP